MVDLGGFGGGDRGFFADGELEDFERDAAADASVARVLRACLLLAAESLEVGAASAE